MHAPGVQGASDPVKVFDRTPNLQGAQIISYRVSPDDKWSVLIGITAGAPERYAERVGSRVGYTLAKEAGTRGRQVCRVQFGRREQRDEPQRQACRLLFRNPHEPCVMQAPPADYCGAGGLPLQLPGANSPM